MPATITKGDFGTFTVLPAYLRSRLHETPDLAGTPIKPAGSLTAWFNSSRNERETYEAFTLEARLSSPATLEHLNWVVGAYYLNESTDRQ